jgi:hypothetical protein
MSWWWESTPRGPSVGASGPGWFAGLPARPFPLPEQGLIHPYHPAERVAALERFGVLDAVRATGAPPVVDGIIDIDGVTIDYTGGPQVVEKTGAPSTSNVGG